MQQDAILYSGLLDAGQHVVHELLQGRRAWLHVVEGELKLGDLRLEVGDGVGITAERALSFTADSACEVLLLDLPAVASPAVAPGASEPDLVASLDGGTQAYRTPSHSNDRRAVVPKRVDQERFAPLPAQGDQLHLQFCGGDPTRKTGRSRWAWLLKRVLRWMEAANRPDAIGGLLAEPLGSCPNCLQQFGARSRGTPLLSAAAS
jgi:hypothetical protein